MQEPALNKRSLVSLASPAASAIWMAGLAALNRRSLNSLGRWCVVLLVFVLGGCASYGIVRNQPLSTDAAEPYSLHTWATARREEDMVFILAFSGGGTRAAAMAYGVLEELRDTPVQIDGREQRALDLVTHISSVSGGSFTAAYYGLYGEQLFENFRNDFLLRDVQGALTRSLFVPTHWFSKEGRTDRAIEYYNEILFRDKTFADMMDTARPMIVINASDLAYGVRFSFIQNYFDLLCSDLRSFPVANAVAASSAVPGVFNPVVVENYPGCAGFKWPENLIETFEKSDELAQTVQGLESFSDKEHRKYIQFVDGGITDNMGLRAMSEVIAISGGPVAFAGRFRTDRPRHIIFISVNASTRPGSDMNQTNRTPSILATMNAVTDIQLHRYNAASVDGLREKLDAWAAALSTPDQPITPHFIEVRFEEVSEPDLKLFLNKIPTTFKLTPEQVDTLIKSARELLRQDPDFQQLLKEFGQR